MKKHISDFVFKVSDILADPNPEILSIKQKIPAWNIAEMIDFKLNSEVWVNCEFQKIERGKILGIFNIEYQIKGKCFRCLDDATGNVSFDTEAIFSVYKTEDSAEFIISKYGEINILDFLEQEIITHLPQDFKCKSSCKGLCRICGNNNNIRKCKCLR